MAQGARKSTSEAALTAYPSANILTIAASDKKSTSSQDTIEKPARAHRPQQRKLPLNQIYVRPAPIHTFPLPAFHPTNPLSLVYLISTWVSQTISPPTEPSIVHDGIWYPETRSVHVADAKSMRALWEQGFYGKGNLSRSEPHWLERQMNKNSAKTVISENITVKRREERQKAKWERAKAQQEAIERTRQIEAETALLEAKQGMPTKMSRFTAPVTPLALLKLPNSEKELCAFERQHYISNSHAQFGKTSTISIGHALHDLSGKPSTSVEAMQKDAKPYGGPSKTNGIQPQNGVLKLPAASSGSESGSEDSKSLKRVKSVRFSPRVESTTFKFSDPPNPNVVPPAMWWRLLSGASEWLWNQIPSLQSPDLLTKAVVPSPTADIENIEHLQLTPVEAFFLAFAFGALRILDPSTRDPMPLEKVFILFRQHSYFPARVSDPAELRPDDPFLLHYIVYHHFRSIGWCVRPGIKFGVDWLLYIRGPVFNHAEFGILVLPSYSDQRWKDIGQEAPKKSWNWLSGIGRTLSQVFKSLVLVYVDVPPPLVFEVALRDEGFAGAFKRYKVREIMMGRWLHNRNRSVAPGPEAKGRGKVKEK